MRIGINAATHEIRRNLDEFIKHAAWARLKAAFTTVASLCNRMIIT